MHYRFCLLYGKTKTEIKGSQEKSEYKQKEKTITKKNYVNWTNTMKNEGTQNSHTAIAKPEINNLIEQSQKKLEMPNF